MLCARDVEKAPKKVKNKSLLLSLEADEVNRKIPGQGCKDQADRHNALPSIPLIPSIIVENQIETFFV